MSAAEVLLESAVQNVSTELQKHIDLSQIVPEPVSTESSTKTKQPVYQFHELKSPRQRYLFDELMRFYSNTDYVETVIIPLLKKNNTENLSRRLINCLSANLHMQCAMRAILPLSRPDSESCYAIFDLASSYLRELKTWRRKLYDTFHRHERILWPLASKPGWCLETTEGLLNFFQWWIAYSIQDLAVENRHLMIEYMQSTKAEVPSTLAIPEAPAQPEAKKRRKRKRQESYLTFRLGVIDLPRNVKMRVHPNFFQ